MGKVFDQISDDLKTFIEAQHMFFVATAPLSEEGHINLSPKGCDTFRVLSSNRVAYLDMIGSGNETSAHLRENGRITFMFCAFDGPCNIVRLYGTGRTVIPTDAEWNEYAPLFPAYINARQIFVAEIDRVSTACGYAVPLMEYQGDRDTLIRWAENKGEEGLAAYQREKNVVSVDGLLTPLGDVFQQEKTPIS